VIEAAEPAVAQEGPAAAVRDPAAADDQAAVEAVVNLNSLLMAASSESLVATFSSDYLSARTRFRAGVERQNWTLESLPIDASADGLELTIDVAASSGPADNVLLLSSGVHGVEGFLGSAVQLSLLDRLAEMDSAWRDVRLVCIHAVNPYGFAAMRRFDENNVDLNRNFLPADASYTGAPDAYVALDALINPQRPPSAWEPFLLKAVWQVARHGMPRLRQALAGGQYDFPQGLFYGGAEPTQSHRLLAENMPRWLEGSRRVIHLDFHTGLGHWGGCRLLIDYPLTDLQRSQLTQWYGAAAFETCDETEVAYQAQGGWSQWCVSQGFSPEYVYACAEYGTYKPLTVFAGLRAENSAHHWGEPDHRATVAAKARLKELFAPASPAWRKQVLNHAASLIDQSLQGLAAGA